MLNKLKVINGKLTDGEKPVRLFGLSTHGIAWYPEYVCEESFAALKNEWRTNCVRITMYTDEFRWLWVSMIGSTARKSVVLIEGIAYLSVCHALDLFQYIYSYLSGDGYL